MSQIFKIIEFTFVILAYLQFCTLVPLESNDQGRKVNHWIEVQKMLKEKVNFLLPCWDSNPGLRDKSHFLTNELACFPNIFKDSLKCAQI